MSFSDRLSIVVFLAVCFLCTLSQAENQAAAQADEASLIGFPSSDILLAEDDGSDQDGKTLTRPCFQWKKLGFLTIRRDRRR